MFCLPFDVFGVALCELVYLRQAVNAVCPKNSLCKENHLMVLGRNSAILCILNSIQYSIFVKLNWCVIVRGRFRMILTYCFKIRLKIFQFCQTILRDKINFMMCNQLTWNCCLITYIQVILKAGTLMTLLM